MRIYIASKYQKHIIINREITDVLTKNGFEVFLQESINNNGISIEQMKKVGLICYKEIEKSDVLLVVSPYKRSVSAEIGYAIRKKLFEKQIQNFNQYQFINLMCKEIVSLYKDRLKTLSSFESVFLIFYCNTNEPMNRRYRNVILTDIFNMRLNVPSGTQP